MTRSRLDRLLEEALRTGEIPDGLTPGERVEIARLVAQAALLRQAGRVSASEAEASQAGATLRFRRHLAAAPAAPDSRRWFGRRTALAALGTAAAAAVLGLVVLAAVQLGTGDIDTAAAIAPGDFVQLQGTIESAEQSPDGHSLLINTAVGQLDVTIPLDATVTEGDATRAASTLKPGEGLLLSGQVGKGRKVEARSVAVTKLPRPADLPVVRLQELRESFNGRVLSVALVKDGRTAKVVVLSPAGERFLVHVDAAVAARLFQDASTLPGNDVLVHQPPGAKQGSIDLQLVRGTDPQPTRPALDEVRGVVASRTLNELTVTTRKGTIRVLINRETRFFVAPGALDSSVDAAGAPLVGHEVTISVGHGRDGAIVAHILAVGPKVRGMQEAGDEDGAPPT